MNTDLKICGTIDLSGAKAQIVQDPVGRRCIAINLGGKDILLTATHALLVRELLEHGVRMLVRYDAKDEVLHEPSNTEESPL